ncbi:acyl-CoA synthetase [Sulfitobacter sp. EhC04]|uniref:acyl-CoA synthetase n=1 Tax=Sulfitobacter sp. EhC04 TaxID=1849168 RepID=UPI0007F41244|nr:AMP-binding protein [Sulfitobacter sp. EhC04]OAN75133.1 acyl-CoA synthetase [Sulfitobacter sp. EhC04]
MITFDHIARDYETAWTTYKPDIPTHFNFAFDVLDVRSREADKDALLAVNITAGTKTAVTYSELSTVSAKFGQALLALGLQRGDAACVVIGREPAWHKVLFGCMKAGVISMPGTNLLTAKDIAYRINQAGAKAVIVSLMHVEKVDSIRAECPTLEHLIVVGEASGDWLSFEMLCADQDGSLVGGDVAPFSASDTMMIYFTSGTTALPKMVPRDFGYALAHAATALFWMDLRESDIHWTLTDTGWAKAAWGMLFPQMLMGCTTVLYDAPGMDVEAHLRAIKEIGVTTFCAPPTVYRLFAQQDLTQYDLSSLRRCLGAGEPLNPEVIRYWQEHTGTIIADGYGQTETINIVGNFPGLETRNGSMGKPVPGFDINVVDDEGSVLPDDEVGHIAIKISDAWPAGLFHGYLRDGELITDSFRNGWYYTGDTASRDPDGYLWFVGRSDDLISSSGYRISPFEVESALLEHDKIMESAVIGVPDETRGQLVKAYIILADGVVGSEALAAEIQDFCKNLTAPYKYPREIEFVDSLPKTISGKIRRVELRGA